MLVILESVWKTIKKNFEKGIRTFIDIDEIYLMLGNDYCVNFYTVYLNVLESFFQSLQELHRM